LRPMLGRKASSATVVERLVQSMTMGMITSADLLYGLARQSSSSLLSDVDQLQRIGIHGLSLYRLNLSRRNRGLLRAFPEYQRDGLRECIMLQAAEQS